MWVVTPHPVWLKCFIFLSCSLCHYQVALIIWILFSVVKDKLINSSNIQNFSCLFPSSVSQTSLILLWFWYSYKLSPEPEPIFFQQIRSTCLAIRIVSKEKWFCGNPLFLPLFLIHHFRKSLQKSFSPVFSGDTVGLWGTQSLYS